jgi:LacI family fructose operon transcriptional repressor
VKLSDIARLAGVSVTTASYVINGKAEQQRISPRNRGAFGQSSNMHDFTPNPQAAGLRSRHSPHAGLYFAGSGKPQLRAYRQAAGTRGARAHGYQLLIASSDDAPDSELQLLQLFRARRCDALIVASCLPAGDDSYRQLQAKGTPIIAIDRVMDPEHLLLGDQ